MIVDAEGRRRRPRWVLPTIGAAAALLLVVGVVGGIWSLRPDPSGTVVDMRGNRVAADPGTTPKPAVRAAMNVDNSLRGERFEVPSVGLNVPLGALNTVDGVIQPPGFTSAYWVRNKGAGLDHPNQGTVFVVMHSMRGGGVAPGNYLIDLAAGTAKVAVGATITVDGINYTVTGSGPVSKTQLPTDAEVWANTPNRLVVITCLQVPAHTESIDNLVITATRQP